jgi:hypothetical protein
MRGQLGAQAHVVGHGGRPFKRLFHKGGIERSLPLAQIGAEASGDAAAKAFKTAGSGLTAPTKSCTGGHVVEAFER